MHYTRQIILRPWNSHFELFHCQIRVIRNFGGAICGTEELIITPIDAIASVRVIETAYAALRSEKWHQVTPASQFRRNTASAHVVSH